MKDLLLHSFFFKRLEDEVNNSNNDYFFQYISPIFQYSGILETDFNKKYKCFIDL